MDSQGEERRENVPFLECQEAAMKFFHLRRGKEKKRDGENEFFGRGKGEGLWKRVGR